MKLASGKMRQVSKKKQNFAGFTLIEVLIYAALFVIIGVVAASFFIQISNVAEVARRSRESNDNARRVIDVINQEVRHAVDVYTPTSTFDSNPGQLSLETTRDLPADENTTYVDFYFDDAGVYIKREGKAEELITSEKIEVTDLTFTHLANAGSADGVRTNVTVRYKDPTLGPETEVSLVSTATLRSYE